MREEAIIKNQDRILATAAKVLKKQHLILYIFNKDSSPEVYGYGFSENELKDSSQFFHLIKHTQESRSAINTDYRSKFASNEFIIISIWFFWWNSN
jgi:formylmethanofuran dehydrogenase subunit E-like metal-binding protein